MYGLCGVLIGLLTPLAVDTTGRNEIAAPAARPFPAELRTRVEAAIGRGLEFLVAAQEADGGWTARFGPGITAIVARAFVQAPAYGESNPVVRRATGYVLKFVQPDGGIYQPEMNIANYQTSVALMLLAGLTDRAGRDAAVKAEAFLKQLQFDAGEKIAESDPWYGGAGYTQRKRPDLSNTQMMLEALHSSGLPPSDPTFQKALKFISRCQMYGEGNDQPFARGARDGGFIYSSVGGGESKAGRETIDGDTFLRTYGSMTYAGFKSMLFAGLDRTDPRVRAARDWIGRHWTLDANPNMPAAQATQGLYYYFHVFARAMRAWGEPVIVDAAGQPHDWRVELSVKLLSLQRSDGSWINGSADRWEEGNANYATALSILSLQEVLADLERAAGKP